MDGWVSVSGHRALMSKSAAGGMEGWRGGASNQQVGVGTAQKQRGGRAGGMAGVGCVQMHAG